MLKEFDKHTARATARVEREAPDSKDTATFLRRARAASLKAIGSRSGVSTGAVALKEFPVSRKQVLKEFAERPVPPKER